MANSHRSVMEHSFAQVPNAEIQRSKFDRSSGHKTTFDAGKLVPFFIDEALPGDTFNLKTAGFTRLATPLFPVMDNMFQETFYFAVPYRLIWDNFQKMMGEQKNPGDSVDFLLPTVTAPPATGWEEGSIGDYLGIPTKVPDLETHALFHRAYNLIWNEWFRDQNLQDSWEVPTDDGPDDWSIFGVAPRGKRHDYFTSALPWPQKGDSVDIPIGMSAPIVATGPAGEWFQGTAGPLQVLQSPASSPTFPDDDGVTMRAQPANAFDDRHIEMHFTGEADLTNATAATINQLRQAFQIQKMYERDARGGTRYTELVRSHFGVTSPDARLQRPEYLGGGSTPVNISPLASTADTVSPGLDGANLGRLSAVGTASFNGHGFTKSFTEHTIVIGLVNIRADLTYQQGLNRMFNRRDKLDFYWPALAHIGEQEVLSKEIYADGTEEDENVFGYQERFAEYRYKPSIVTGQFRSNADLPLDAWHLAQEFANRPVLSEQFIVDEPPVDRILAVTDEPQFIADFYHKLITARPMPMFGVPGNIDRF